MRKTKSKKKKKGFTLVELLVTIAILGIITGMAIPLVRNAQSRLQEKRYKTYISSLEHGAKLYNDTYSIDLFGHKKSGCAYVYYNQLQEKQLAKDIDMSGISCATDKTLVKVIKYKSKYYFDGFIGCGTIPKSGNVTPNIFRPENFQESEMCKSESPLVMDVTTSPQKSTSNAYKRIGIKVIITTNTGISVENQPSIEYGFTADKKVMPTEWHSVVFKSSEIKNLAEQEELIFNKAEQNINSKQFVTPEGYHGELYVVLRINRLEDLSGENWTTDDTKYIYSIGTFRTDNQKPKFNDSSVISKETNYNTTTPKLDMKATDSFSSEEEMKICVSLHEDKCDKSEEGIKNYEKYSTNKNKILPKIANSYDGKTYKVYVTIADLAGNYDTKELTYRVSKEFKITYNDNSGSGCSSTEQKQYENLKWGELCSPSKTHYVFTSWNTKADGTGTKVDANSTATSDLTLYAQWTPATYTLTYDNTGGSGCSSVSKTYNNEWGTLCTPTKANNVFLGWYTNSDGSGTNITSTSKATSDLKVYAKWTASTKKLKYYGNSNTGGSTGDTNCTYNQDCTIANNGFTRTGHTFTGWNTKADGTGTAYAAGGKIKITSDTNLYAQWKANTYTVTYAGNGNTGGSTSSSTCTYGKAISTNANGFVKSHYTFTGWSGKPSTCSENVTLTASWRANNAIIRYHTGTSSGSVLAHKPDNTWTIQNNYQIWHGNTQNIQTIAYGTSHDLLNYHNENYLYIKKTSTNNGKVKSTGAWEKCNGTNACVSSVYKQSTNYTSEQYCDTTNGDCICCVKVNWE